MPRLSTAACAPPPPRVVEAGVVATMAMRLHQLAGGDALTDQGLATLRAILATCEELRRLAKVAAA